jgi:hypothetical protein
MLRIGLPLLFLAALFATHPYTDVMALNTVISSVSRLDLSSGRISGEKADYYLDVPTMWSGYLIADREKITNGSRPLEKLNFYYEPMDGITKPVPFLDLSVYDKNNYSLPSGQHELLETKDYIFTVWIAPDNTLTNKTDHAIFNILLQNATDDQYLISLIRLSPGDEKLYNDTIWVNGTQLNVKAITDSNIHYLPIREVCETLGYKVGWIPESNAITLSRGDYYRVLIINNISADSGFSIKLNNNRSYISSLFFISQLSLNVEIDERANVTLNEY